MIPISIDIILRLIGQDNASQPIKNAKREAENLKRAIDGVGNSSGLEVAESKAKAFWQEVDTARDKTENLTRTLEQTRNIGAGLAVVGAGMAAIGAKALGAASHVQNITIGFETMLGSASAAADMIEKIRAFDVSSPFDFAQSAAGAQKLLAMGVAAEKIIPTMTAIGDAVSAAGGGQDAFNGILLALGQISTKGKVSSEELNQMAERGIPALRILQRELGLTQEQVGNIGKEGIAASVAIPALLKGFEKDFGGAMAKSAETLEGKLSTLEGATGQLGATLGMHLVPTVSLAVDAATTLTNIIAGMPEPLQKAAAGLYGVTTVGATLGGTLLAIGSQVGMLTLAFPGLGAASLTAFTTMKTAAATTIPFLLGVAKALAVPFAILAAGAAVGIAGYEALRATGILKNHKSTAEIMADTRKTLMGDPAGEAQKSVAAATSANPMPAMPSVPSAPATPTTAVDTSATTPTAGAAKTKGRKGPDPAKAAAAAAKKAKSAADKETKYRAKLADAVADRAADIEVATMEEVYATRIAQLEASKPRKGDSSAIDAQIDRLKAEQMVKESQIRSKYSDSYAESGAPQIAAIRAKGLLDRSGIVRAGETGGTNSVGMAINALQRGGGMAVLGNGTGTGGAPTASTPSGGTVTAKVASAAFDAVGNWVVQFERIVIPPSRLATNVNGLRN